jgi:hypothetical protein
LDGKACAVAVYYAAGGAYRDFSKVIFNTAQTSLLIPRLNDTGEIMRTANGGIMKKVLLFKNWWTLNFKMKPAGNFTPWRPVIKLLKEETGADTRAYCAGLISGAPEAASE